MRDANTREVKNEATGLEGMVDPQTGPPPEEAKNTYLDLVLMFSQFINIWNVLCLGLMVSFTQKLDEIHFQ